LKADLFISHHVKGKFCFKKGFDFESVPAIFLQTEHQLSKFYFNLYLYGA